MKISTNGQVSIPAETRSRWNADQLTVVDLGDRVVMRPLPKDPIQSLRGKYKGLGPDTARMRELEREETAE